MKTFSFRSKIWKYQGQAAWHFITLPKTVSIKIRKQFGLDEEGWGRLKTVAKTGKTEWKTAIWYDTKADGYLLPLKADIRKKEKLANGDTISVLLTFLPTPQIGRKS